MKTWAMVCPRDQQACCTFRRQAADTVHLGSSRCEAHALMQETAALFHYRATPIREITLARGVHLRYGWIPTCTSDIDLGLGYSSGI